jgi:BlaI family transcriptional regulator, penicillinase repressor
MAGRKSTTFTELELEFMKIIWEKGAANTEDIQKALGDKGRELSDGAIRRIFAILMDKGHLTRKKIGRNFVYFAKVEKEQAGKKMVLDLLTRAFSDSVSLMVTTILNSRDIKKDELEELKKLIAEHEREAEK